MGTRGPKSRPAVERFWDAVVKRESGCWLYRDRSDVYGQVFGDDGKQVLAHRYSYRLHKGEIPAGLFVCHTCDVRGCVNPDHLYAGTHEENTRDIVERKRFRAPKVRVVRKLEPGQRQRSKRGNRELRVWTVEKLRQEYESGQFTQTELAYRYSISQGTVSAIIRKAKNMGDGKGKNAKRESKNYRRKLSLDDYQKIRDMYATGQHTQTALAAQFGCDQTYVSAIVNNKLRSNAT